MDAHPMHMLEEEVRRVAVARLRRGLDRIAVCLGLLGEDEVWKDFNTHLVSIGNQLLHLVGNLRQHVLSGLGGEPYVRDREQEFMAKPGLSVSALLEGITSTVTRAVGVISGLTGESLVRRYVIQGYAYTGVQDVMAVVEHFSYHVGQITFAVKLVRDVDVGYSRGVDLNQQNQPAP